MSQAAIHNGVLNQAIGDIHVFLAVGAERDGGMPAEESEHLHPVADGAKADVRILEAFVGFHGGWWF